NPFYRSFTEDFATRHRVSAETIASAIRIGDPVSFDRAVAAIRATNGVVADVTDDEIMAAKRDIDRMGIGCEPASAATLAGVRKLGLKGTIVCVLTGHVLKDTDAVGGEVVEIDADVEQLGVILRRADAEGPGT